MTTSSAFSLTQEDWKNYFKQNSLSENLVPYWTDGLYKNRNLWRKHLSENHINFIQSHFSIELPRITRILESNDGTYKFQISFHDGLEVESVLIPFHKRYTICLSTQVGCAMNCSFCFTGTQGLKRNLEAGEIVTQYLLVKDWLLNKDSQALMPNIVFMGQGEPLHNFLNVKKAIEVLNDPQLIGVGHRQMTLSTVGYLPGMHNLESLPKINFALSLHSPFDEERQLLIPVNQRYPIDQILEKFDQMSFLKRQFLTIEYLLIKNLNMTERHAEALSEKFMNKKIIMNLIPFNPFPGAKWERPGHAEIEDFKQLLVQKKLRVMVRTTKGEDILAACGQLKINQMARAL
jgi:23S rRNA (adenine2503-C2)-methyltransferase